MKMHISKGGKAQAVLLVALLIIVALLSDFSSGSGPGPNYRNYSVDTRVNITSSPPVVIAVTVPSPVTLTAGSLTGVECNFSIRDYNGFADISAVNSTLFSTTVAETSVDNNNTKYTNTSCSVIAGQQSGAYANYSCQFSLNYYAINGSWTCLGFVNDTAALTARGNASLTVNALYALNVTPLIDYGDMNAGAFSDNETANVTNLGNIAINITVQGYGRNLSDNLSFVCDQGNLSIGLEHFAANSTANWTVKQNLSSTFAQIAGLTVAKTTNASSSFNTTYWELYIDPAQIAFGQCNGTIIFQAEAS
jgi:hypothetical protein